MKRKTQSLIMVVHITTSDMRKFVKFKSHDGEIFRVGNNASYQIRGIVSITFDGKTYTDDVYFVFGLKHNLLSIGQLKDKGYQLQFGNDTCIIKKKEGKLLGTSTRTRGNVFQLNSIEITCLVAKIDNSWLWHRRFFHINFDNIVKVGRTFVVTYLPKITKPIEIVCKECILAKQERVSFPNKKFTTIEKLEIVHTDLSRPSKTRGFYGERYFMIFVDDFTRMMWVAFLKEKSEALEKFKIFKKEWKMNLDLKSKI